ncbi:MAG: anthranilate synthase component I family protein [Pseudomonadota bacterium]|uniref:anthranilate synthase component I family protein n=1 Tax=Alcanivorax sp. TaxID=1872427 RepID=UPI0025C43D82|nr:anthranilate synthase component I family protein [Alcanivorax sp.]MED5238226.1 anthranilate synthase component I family protein [Pseudomonadota bacterium]MEE3320072.1 anthranilate synthase component I family protein [Pseudomonadota bacterium]
MNPSCVFLLEGQLVALPTPLQTLTLTAPEKASALIQEVNRRLATDCAFAAGLIPYEFNSGNNASPLVIHLYPSRPVPLPTAFQAGTFELGAAFQAQVSKTDYLASLARIKAYLAAGDCYQVNLAQRFATTFTGSPLTAWLNLQADHPAPHSCYFDSGASTVFGVSPERFLSIQGRKVVTEPIKGSRPRSLSPAEDKALGDELLANPKDRAENLMIVDLLRNDLGAVCTPGSVTAAPLFELRKFSNVQHLVSTIQGELRSDVSSLEALLQAFPGGSITGAPKKRAMEIIAELEPAPRGAYCGSFFWMDNQGNLDSNILIRTLQTEGNNLYCHGGGGIVFDSDPEAEYEESRFKVEKLMGALESRFLAKD